MPPTLPPVVGAAGGGGLTGSGWPATRKELGAVQEELGRLEPPPWQPETGRPLDVAGAFVASATGLLGTGAAGDPLWAAAVLVRVDPSRRDPITLGQVVVRGEAGGPYERGFLALREGALLERIVRALGEDADVVLLNATGRDHPRRAGLALHLGTVLDRPSVGVTDRSLLAPVAEPAPEHESWTPLVLGGEIVGAALRTRRGARPVLVHAAWRTDAAVAREVLLRVAGRARTPEPIRRARRLAREARARDEGRAPGA